MIRLVSAVTLADGISSQFSDEAGCSLPAVTLAGRLGGSPVDLGAIKRQAAITSPPPRQTGQSGTPPACGILVFAIARS